MACILKAECNFLHRYFRCLLPKETVNVEVKMKMMRGIHMFRRDWTTQVISCNPWSTSLHPYQSLIKKMKTYLELEGKLDNQPCTNVFLPYTNSVPRKIPAPKEAEKKRRAKLPAKRSFKVRVITQPITANPILPINPIPPTVPTLTVATSTATTQIPVAKSAATSIAVTVYNLAQGKFKEIPYATTKLQEGEGSSASSCRNPQEQQPEAAATVTAFQNREDTP